VAIKNVAPTASEKVIFFKCVLSPEGGLNDRAKCLSAMHGLRGHVSIHPKPRVMKRTHPITGSPRIFHGEAGVLARLAGRDARPSIFSQV
jgi:hypothetical protein